MRRTILFVGLALFFAVTPPKEALRADTADGSCIEDFTLQNFQTASPTYEQYVRSFDYTERPTVVLLLTGG
jgi:hypothetical protein